MVEKRAVGGALSVRSCVNGETDDRATSFQEKPEETINFDRAGPISEGACENFITAMRLATSTVQRNFPELGTAAPTMQ